MTEQEISKVEEYIQTKMSKEYKVVTINTIKNPRKLFDLNPAYLTDVMLEDKLKRTFPRQFNSLKILRGLKKREKYGAFPGQDCGME